MPELSRANKASSSRVYCCKNALPLADATFWDDAAAKKMPLSWWRDPDDHNDIFQRPKAGRQPGRLRGVFCFFWPTGIRGGPPAQGHAPGGSATKIVQILGEAAWAPLQSLGTSSLDRPWVALKSDQAGVGGLHEEEIRQRFQAGTEFLPENQPEKCLIRIFDRGEADGRE